MRIAIGPLFDEFGGISKHLRGIRKYSRHHVDILPTDADRARVNNDPAAIRRYQESARSKLASYDVLHSHVYLWHTQMSSRALGASQRWIHTYHTLYFNQDYPHGLDAKQLWINEDLTKLARAADAKISVGDWLARHLSDEHAISTRVVPNGVDVRLCEGANADRFVAKHGVRDFVLYLSSSKPIKNPGLFLELACRIPELNFVMIGRELSVTQLYQECGRPPPSNLTVIGELDHPDALDAIAASRVVVMTSRREGCPTVLLEAMAMAKPVVVPAHSGCVEIVPSEEYGFLYDLNSPNELVQKTRQAMESKHVGESARERVLRCFDWAVLARQIDVIYEGR